MSVQDSRNLNHTHSGRSAAPKSSRVSASRAPATPEEIAQDVYWLPIRGSNVYFVRSEGSWVLIDAAWGKCAQVIRDAAERLFGANARPAAIMLTHDHPDHVGAASELAREWGCPVFVHPDELPLTTAKDLATVERFAIPMDRWFILPVMRVLPRRWITDMLSKSSLDDVVHPFDVNGGIPGLPDWMCIPTPGHSPGHVAFFRERDRVLICGDALLTVDLNSVRGWISWRLNKGAAAPALSPWYMNWDQQAAEASAAELISLKPRVIASGHGRPVTAQLDRECSGAASEPTPVRG